MIYTSKWFTPAVLFLITLATTTITGMGYSGASLNEWYRGLWFSLPLMFILLTHEMGHYLVAKKHRVDVSPPYFIPLPPPLGLGTLGAVIKMKDPVTKPSALIDIGAAGPLAGLVAAFFVLIAGISMSTVSDIPLNRNYELMSEGNSIFYLLIKYIIKGELLPSGNRDIMMHPVAFAGWIGLLITMINLIPVGQLDGGHIAHGKFGNKYNDLSDLLHRFLPVFGVVIVVYVTFDSFFSSYLKYVWFDLSGLSGQAPSFIKSFQSGISSAIPWFIWPIMLLVIRKLSGGAAHPPVSEGSLTKTNHITFWVIVVVFIIIFMPVPMRMN
ncbi:site-2 protease family protein [Myxococcota bacterium]|nr:site-2 protease family protein [Myxococcota bacterium]MBU1382802.1 site-2 protease family protein [Myxococcota bacterium]MBU1497375.1 site-2 protease family protein [Myxococcota bacterium]